VAVSETAEREWLDLVGHLLASPLTALPAEAIARQLLRTFRANGCAFHVRVPGRRIWPIDLHHFNRWSAESAPTGHPVLRYYLATGERVAVQVADVPREIADQRVLGRWYDLSRPFGVTDQVALPLQRGPHDQTAFVIGRDRPFTAGEMELVAVLQRLLSGLDHQVRLLARAHGAATPAGAAVAADARLTPREIAALAAVAGGLTAAAAGHRLGISARTVHKHLERAYGKLGVTDRVSAVLRAQQLGLMS